MCHSDRSAHVPMITIGSKYPILGKRDNATSHTRLKYAHDTPEDSMHFFFECIKGIQCTFALYRNAYKIK